MLTLGPLGFAAPWVLTALIALPVLWLLLRAVPPAPREVTFPGTALLAGLPDPAPITRRTPWWLLALRMAAVAALILGLAGPVWKPAPLATASGPLLVVMDAGWQAAPGWTAARARALAALEQAAADARPAALLLADGQAGRGETLPFQPAAEQAARLRGADPQPWETRYPPDPLVALADAPEEFATLWLSDGLDHPGRAEWLAALAARGPVSVVPQSAPVRSLQIEPGPTPALIMRSTADGPWPAVLAVGPDPQGTPRTLARLTAPEGADRGMTTFPIDLPSELRNRVTRFALEGEQSAGAVILADDRVRRPKVALAGDVRSTETQALLSPLHYLRQALAPRSDLIEGTLAEVIPAAPDVIILSDQILEPYDSQLPDWVQGGGLLIRFAGPRMAGSDLLDLDPLLPVRIRPGGRDVGGALSWGEPRGLVPFDPAGPFAGLTTPDDVTVRAQLMAEPDPELSARTIAALSDGTPLVTREELGQGQVVLFHTSASADWSSLPLSGLFVEMLGRLVQSAAGRGAGDEAPLATADEHPFWTAELVLDGFGRPADPADVAPIAAEALAAGPAPGVPVGIYAAGQRRIAVNAGGELAPASAPAAWPGARVEQAAAQPGLSLRGWLIALAATLLAADAVASAALAGRRGGMAKAVPA